MTVRGPADVSGASDLTHRGEPATPAADIATSAPCHSFMSQLGPAPLRGRSSPHPLSHVDPAGNCRRDQSGAELLELVDGLTNLCDDGADLRCFVV